jgi:hypothetical protein
MTSWRGWRCQRTTPPAAAEHPRHSSTASEASWGARIEQTSEQTVAITICDLIYHHRREVSARRHRGESICGHISIRNDLSIARQAVLKRHCVARGRHAARWASAANVTRATPVAISHRKHKHGSNPRRKRNHFCGGKSGRQANPIVLRSNGGERQRLGLGRVGTRTCLASRASAPHALGPASSQTG